MTKRREIRFFRFGYGGISTIILFIAWIVTSFDMIRGHMEHYTYLNRPYPFADARDVIVNNFLFYLIIWLVWSLILGHWNRSERELHIHVDRS